MSSIRMVSLGFLLCMALMPALLLSIARGHPDAATLAVTTIGLPGEDGKPARAWSGAPKATTSAASTNARPSAPPNATAVAVVELYVVDSEAAAISREVSAAHPGTLVLTFGASQTKSEPGTGIDPYVGVEAAKRRRAYARALNDGRESIGPAVVASPGRVAGPEKPTAAWVKEQVAAAGSTAGPAELTVKASRPSGKGAGTAWQVEFAAKVDQKHPAFSEDAMINRVLAEPMGAETGAPLRVVSFKPFKLPKGGNGTVEIAPPTGGSPTRLVAILQHAKTMRVMAIAGADLK